MNLNDFSEFTRVVIIDDNKDDGIAIRDALAEQNISSLFLHFVDRTSLPKKPFNNVRLVFLDLELIKTGSEKSKAAATLTYLKSIVKENSFYILVIWSVHIGSDLEKEFDSMLNNRLIKIQPCIPPIVLTKAGCKKRNGSYSFFKIKTKIKKGFKKFLNYDLFIRWENIVENSLSQFLLNLLSNESQRKLSQKIHALAEAYAGEKYKNDLSKHSLLAVNEALKGMIDDNVSSQDFTDSNKCIYSRAAKLGKNKIAILNTHLSVNPHKTLGPGCIFQFKGLGSFNSLVEEPVNNNCINIVVDVTPICDAAQNKNKFSYYVQGMLVSETSKIKRWDCIYEFRNVFEYRGKIYKIVLNLRSLEAIRKKAMGKMETEKGKKVSVKINPYVDEGDILMKLRDNIVIDFQHRIAFYSSRPGHILL